MVCTRVLSVFVLGVVVQAQPEQVVFRGMGDDGTYSEVRHSDASIPGGHTKTVTSFSSRVSSDPDGGAPVMRFGGLSVSQPSLGSIESVGSLGSLRTFGSLGRLRSPGSRGFGLLGSQNLFNRFSVFGTQSPQMFNLFSNRYPRMNSQGLSPISQLQPRKRNAPLLNDYYGNGFSQGQNLQMVPISYDSTPYQGSSMNDRLL